MVPAEEDAEEAEGVLHSDMPTIDLHPTRAGLAIHNFECVDCGPVKSKVYSLR
jgi:hypothetical protein